LVRLSCKHTRRLALNGRTDTDNPVDLLYSISFP